MELLRGWVEYPPEVPRLVDLLGPVPGAGPSPLMPVQGWAGVHQPEGSSTPVSGPPPEDWREPAPRREPDPLGSRLGLEAVLVRAAPRWPKPVAGEAGLLGPGAPPHRYRTQGPPLDV